MRVSLQLADLPTPDMGIVITADRVILIADRRVAEDVVGDAYAYVLLTYGGARRAGSAA